VPSDDLTPRPTAVQPAPGAPGAGLRDDLVTACLYAGAPSTEAPDGCTYPTSASSAH